MNDRITIHNLELWTHIGVPDEERTSEQRLLVTIILETDTKPAAEADALEKTIDYDVVAKDVQTLAKTERKTIEKLAEDIATTVVQKYQPTRVHVTVKKYILPNADEVSLTITRP